MATACTDLPRRHPHRHGLDAHPRLQEAALSHTRALLARHGPFVPLGTFPCRLKKPSPTSPSAYRFTFSGNATHAAEAVTAQHADQRFSTADADVSVSESADAHPHRNGRERCSHRLHYRYVRARALSLSPPCSQRELNCNTTTTKVAIASIPLSCSLVPGLPPRAKYCTRAAGALSAKSLSCCWLLSPRSWLSHPHPVCDSQAWPVRQEEDSDRSGAPVPQPLPDPNAHRDHHTQGGSLVGGR